MSEKNLSQKVIEKIEKEKIKPKPRWEFLVKDYLIWSLFGLSVIVGSLAVSIIIFMIDNYSDSGIVRIGLLKFLILRIPFFWLIVLAIFLLVAYYNFKHTKKGYRYNPYLIFLISILISIVFGSVIYVCGGSEKLEKIFYNRLWFYRSLMEHQGRAWISTESGRLAGVVISEINNDRFSLKSFNGIIWTIILEEKLPQYRLIIKRGNRLQIFGEQIDRNSFKAKIIRPWFCKECIPPRINQRIKENHISRVLIERKLMDRNIIDDCF